MKKLLTLILIATLFLCGCSATPAQNQTKPTESSASVSTPSETAETEVQPEETSSQENEPAESIPEETEPAETVSPESTPDESGAQQSAALIGDEIINFDKVQFSLNGKVYTLGETTLNTLIEDGVEFNEDDIANAQNNLNKHTQSQNFRIPLGEYWSAMVYTMNSTDENQTTADCYINEVYLPIYQDKTQDIIALSFPLNLTMEDLIAQAGEPTKSDHYESEDGTYIQDTLSYKKDSTMYYRDWGYKFEFVNGVLAYVTISYLP